MTYREVNKESEGNKIDSSVSGQAQRRSILKPRAENLTDRQRLPAQTPNNPISKMKDSMRRRRREKNEEEKESIPGMGYRMRTYSSSIMVTHGGRDARYAF